MAKRLLIIDDDVVFTKLLKLLLEKTGYEVATVTSGLEGLQWAYSWDPDLVILDITMPGMDGWAVSQRLRDISDVPILMLTAISGTENVVHGLRLGVDDYVAKPFSDEELLRRIAAILRRASPQSSKRKVEILDGGRFVFDPEQRQVIVNERVVNLTPKEFRLLACLIRSAGRTLPHELLLKEVWGPGHTRANSSYLKQYICCLRRKIEEDPANPRYILTEWGAGYRFHTGKT
jgi:two-component system KDP operon response regulator KdpE